MGIHGLLAVLAQVILLLSSEREAGQLPGQSDGCVTLEVCGVLEACGPHTLDDGFPVPGVGWMPPPRLAVLNHKSDPYSAGWQLNFGAGESYFGDDESLRKKAYDLSGKRVVVRGDRIPPGFSGYGFARGQFGFSGRGIWVRSIRLAGKDDKVEGKAAPESEDYVAVEVRGELNVCGVFDRPPLYQRFRVGGLGSQPCRSEFAVRSSTHMPGEVGWRLNLGEDADLERTATEVEGQSVIVTGERFLPGYNGYGFARGRDGLSEPGIWVRSIRPVEAVPKGTLSFFSDIKR